MRKSTLLLIASLLLMVAPSWAQSGGTAPGILVTATAPSGTVTGYDIWRCPGTCTLSSTWTEVASGLSTPSYLDPASGLSAGSTYSYAMTADNSGVQSPFSNIATVTVPTSGFPSVGSPSGCNAKVQ